METIMVTGATGVIGAPATQELVRMGHRVVGFDLAPNRARLGPEGDDVDIVTGDIADADGLTKALRRHKVGRVLHTAAATGGVTDPLTIARANGIGTGAVFEAALRLGLARVCWTSSSGVYGRANQYPSDRLVDEDDLVGPFSVYRASKVLCEQMSITYRERGLDTIGVRPVASFGLGRSGNGIGLLSDAVRDVALGKPAVFPSMFGPPSATWQPMYAADAAGTLVAGTLVERTEHGIFNAPVSEIYTVGDTMRVLADLAPGCELTMGPPVPKEAMVDSPLLDGSRAKKELGYLPRYTLRGAFEEMIERYRAGEQ
ncbi:MAG: NAD-dependent epimerase/dehydratase family protein [Microbacteriaceae bacterium]